jgi:hypothetical protein
MTTVALTLLEYNDAVVRAALATHQEGADRNGNPPPYREIPGPAIPAPRTRQNIGDSRWVSVTPGPASTRLGGRPRVYATPAAGNRARQRTYRARLRLVRGPQSAEKERRSVPGRGG